MDVWLDIHYVCARHRFLLQELANHVWAQGWWSIFVSTSLEPLKQEVFQIFFKYCSYNKPPNMVKKHYIIPGIYDISIMFIHVLYIYGKNWAWFCCKTSTQPGHHVSTPRRRAWRIGCDARPRADERLRCCHRHNWNDLGSVANDTLW